VEEFDGIITREGFEALSSYGLQVLQNLSQACQNVTEAVEALRLVTLDKEKNRGILEPKDIKAAINSLAATDSPAATDKRKDAKRSYDEDGGVAVLKEPKKRRAQ
jgi:hypothetical protein